MTLEQLKQYNGQNKQKAYVAYKGNVYDVSSSPLWENGIHKKIHEAGLDLTDAMENAPHAEEVFADFDIVETLDEKDESKMDWVKQYYKYHPKSSFATAVFYTFSIATVMGVFTMISGLLSWYINYQLAFTHIFVMKLSFSIITLLLGIVGIIIYLDNPEVVYLTNLPSILYHGIVLLTGITVIVLAYYGGKITWPDKDFS